jgi:radical SAM family uncharacterized protein/radical SAM-linked protein
MSRVPIQDILPFIAHPSRYLGSEPNAIRKDPAAVDLRIALVFPDLYEIGMSHFGLQILYHILNRHHRVAAERVFAPDTDLEQRLRDVRRPLFSLESRRPVNQFDIVAVSLLYELDYTNILTILDLADIPFYAAERRDGDPVIIAGGPCTCNPEPVADFFDAMVIGDGENVSMQLVQSWLEWQAAGKPGKMQLLETWSRIRGVYIPGFFRTDCGADGVAAVEPRFSHHRRIQRAIVSELDLRHFPDAPIVPFGRPVHDRLRLEVARGCTRGCRFCQAGMLYRPVRERSLAEIQRLTRISLKNTGYGDLSLLSLSTGDYTCIEPLLESLLLDGCCDQVAISLPSLRAGTLTPQMMKCIQSVRKTGFTIAPEAGSQRLRNVINKNIGDAEIEDTVRRAFEAGWQVIKLYFMVGLPTETETDMAEMVELVNQLDRLRKRVRPKGRINVSVANFIPKPHTPFQWSAQQALIDSRAKIRWLKEKLPRRGIQFKWQNPEVSHLEGLWARGDRRLSKLLVTAWRRGCRFDGWTDHFDYVTWRESCDAESIDIDSLVSRARHPDDPLPWDHIDVGVSKRFLRQEWQNALAGRTTGDCRTGECHGCGVCDFEKVAPRVCATCDPQQGGEEQPLQRRPSERHAFEIGFSKNRQARFFGHLETVKIVNRALRRAGLPVAYSGGYHPQPLLAFKDALPIGVESLDEKLILRLSVPSDPAQVMTELNRELPDGLSLHSCRRTRKRSFGVPVGKKVYRVTLGTGQFSQTALDAFHAAPEAPMEKFSAKGRSKTIDLKTVVSRMDRYSETEIEMTLQTRPEMTLRPSDILKAVFDMPDADLKRARIVKIKDD